MDRQQHKQLVIDYYREQRRDWLQRAKELARKFALEHGEVCADDIHKLLPIPADVDRRNMGKVFEGMEIKGLRRSERSECHHRRIAVFGIQKL